MGNFIQIVKMVTASIHKDLDSFIFDSEILSTRSKHQASYENKYFQSSDPK